MEKITREIPTAKVRTASEQVADQLRALILEGYFKPGDKLPSQEALCKEFGVGRSTIREGIQSLSADGLINVIHGASGGTVITLPHASDVSERLTNTLWLLSGPNGELSIDELIEIRLLLEVPAAAAAALHRSASDLEDLRIALLHEPSMLTNRDFHRAVVAAAPNRALLMLTEPVFAAVQMRTISVQDQFSKYHDLIQCDHQELFDAIKRQDNTGAAEIMKAHLTRLQPIYLQLLGYSAQKPESTQNGQG